MVIWSHPAQVRRAPNASTHNILYVLYFNVEIESCSSFLLPPSSLHPLPRAQAIKSESGSETGRWLLTEEHAVRDIMCCATYAGDIEALPTSSNQEPDFKSHLPASYEEFGGDRQAQTASFCARRVSPARSGASGSGQKGGGNYTLACAGRLVASHLRKTRELAKYCIFIFQRWNKTTCKIWYLSLHFNVEIEIRRSLRAIFRPSYI